MSEEVFKKLNLVKGDDIDKEASLKYVETHLEDVEWKKLYKSALEICIPDMSESRQELQKEIGIGSEVCNALFDGVVTCMHMVTFAVSLY